MRRDMLMMEGESIPFPQRETVTRRCCKNMQCLQCFLLAALQPSSLPFQMWLLFPSFLSGSLADSASCFLADSQLLSLTLCQANGWRPLNYHLLQRASRSIVVLFQHEGRDHGKQQTWRPEVSACSRDAPQPWMMHWAQSCLSLKTSRGTLAAHQELPTRSHSQVGNYGILGSGTSCEHQIPPDAESSACECVWMT